MKKQIIMGCEGRGDGNSPYLTRYTLIETRWFQLCLHIFHRSDSPELHDHPWNFWTLPLRHGYREVVRTGEDQIKLVDIKPWRLYFRPATHAHRVLLIPSFTLNKAGELVITKKQAVTLVLMTRRRRDWGFFTPGGWLDWRTYFATNRC